MWHYTHTALQHGWRTCSSVHVLYSSMDPPLVFGIDALICLGPHLFSAGMGAIRAQHAALGLQVAGGVQADLLSIWSNILRRSRLCCHPAVEWHLYDVHQPSALHRACAGVVNAEQ